MNIIKKNTREEKQALDFWDEYYKSILNTEIVDNSETEDQKEKRIKDLEKDPERWFKNYFEKYCSAEPMPFHKRSTKRVLDNPEWYEVRPWSRELSKSGRTMLELLYLHCTGKKKFTLMISANKDAAIRLLSPYKKAFEKNPRLINDYGSQVNYGSWAEDEFITRSGSMFLAIGAGQAPRGARNEEVRPDSIIMDDFDTDEDCRNSDIITKKWLWFEQAVYGTRSISEPLLIIFNGNIIADECCIKKAMEVCDYYEIVNIRDKNGKSTWPTKNTEEMIDRVLKKISKESQQKEYYNNPIVLGKVFKSLNYGKIQPLNKYKYLVAYTDPSYKDGKKNDFKATVLIGKWKDQYHVIWLRCEQTNTDTMIDWQYEILKFVNDKSAVFLFIEYPSIDEQLKTSIKKKNIQHNKTLSLKADERDKPNKYYRIESNLEALNRNGYLIFNEELKGNPHMKEVEFQFLALSPKSRSHDDAPDAVEGCVWVIDHKHLQSSDAPLNIPPPRKKQRY